MIASLDCIYMDFELSVKNNVSLRGHNCWTFVFPLLSVNQRKKISGKNAVPLGTGQKIKCSWPIVCIVISAGDDIYQDCYDEVESLGSIQRILKFRVGKGSV